MARFQNQNLQNIKHIFEEHTGVDLKPVRQTAFRRVIRYGLIFAALLFTLCMLAFTQKLFTPLDGDKLSLAATYLGGGIVSIHVQNDSDKKLVFQEQAKLIRWVNGEEVASTGGKVQYENTVFLPHSAGTMTIDLSDAYDVTALENAKTNIESYYLLLTNKDFLFGHDWICSFTFAEPESESAANPLLFTPHSAVHLEDIEEELQFYFKASYNMPLSLNEMNFQYQQRVDELLKRFDGDVVCSLSPSIMVIGPSEYLDPEPMFRDIPSGVIFDSAIAENQQNLLTTWGWSYTDGYGRFIATAGEQAIVQYAMLPQHAAQKGNADGGAAFPLVFYLVYDAERSVNPENYAFVYGQLLPFAELEHCLVLQDSHYSIYNVTDYIYSDIDAYLDHYLTTRQDLYCDDQIRQRVHNIYAFYQDRENIAALYYYRE